MFHFSYVAELEFGKLLKIFFIRVLRIGFRMFLKEYLKGGLVIIFKTILRLDIFVIID